MAAVDTFENEKSAGKIPFDEALDRTGFGLYSYMLMGLTGMIVISTGCIIYGTTIIIPTSACELKTTTTQQGILAAVPLIGAIFGAVIWGYLGDTFGRRNMTLTSLCVSAILNMVTSISVNWIMLLIMQFLASIAASGQYVLAMTILSESVPAARRNVALLLVASIFLLAQGLMALFAMPIIPLNYSIHLETLGIYWNSWRTVVVVYSLPSLISIVWLFFMQESPKYRFVKGDEEGAMNILRIIHRRNKGRKSEYKVKGLLEEYVEVETIDTSGKIAPLFKRPLLKYTIIMSCLFMFLQVGAFCVWLPKVADEIMSFLESEEGTDLPLCSIVNSNTTEIVTDVAPCSLNNTSLWFVLGVGAAQSVLNIVMSIFINKVGRRNMVMGITATCGAAGVLVNLVPSAYGSMALYAIFLMGLLVLGLYTAISVAVFPTHLRATAIALVQAVGRISLIFCVQILNVLLTNNCEVGFYVFGVLFASSAIVASFLPDDRFIAAQSTKSTSTHTISTVDEKTP